MKTFDRDIKYYIYTIVESYHQILSIKKWIRDKFNKGWNNNFYYKGIFFDVIFDNLRFKKLEFYLSLREFIDILKDKNKNSDLKNNIIKQIENLYVSEKYHKIDKSIKKLLICIYDYSSFYAHGNSRMFKIYDRSEKIIREHNLNMEIEIYIFWKKLCLIYQKIIEKKEYEIYSYQQYINTISNILQIQKASYFCKPKIIKLFEEIIKEESIEPFVNPNIGIF